MSARTDHALAHPANTANDVVAPHLMNTETLPGGNLLTTILAVDRLILKLTGGVPRRPVGVAV